MTIERAAIVRVKEGLHARPATRFVKLAKSFRSDIEIARDGKSVSAKSSVKLMLLGVKENDAVTLKVSGADEVDAAQMLVAFLENPAAGLDGEADAAPPAPPGAGDADTPEGGHMGVAASPGAALGPVFAFFPPVPEPLGRDVAPDARAAELGRFDAAVARTVAAMEAAIEGPDGASADAAIIRALIEIATDEELTGRARMLVADGLDAVSAMLTAGATLAAGFEALDDPYQRARADDVNGVARRICLALTGADDVDLSQIPQGAILVADDIGAFDLARAPLARIAGIVCGQGGATSHVAIIARNHAIAAVLGLGEAIGTLKGAGRLAVDGDAGRVFADPDAGVEAHYTARVGAQKAAREALRVYAPVRPTLADGRVIEIAANLGALAEIDAAKDAGAMGVGLFRTELMFMAHAHLPGEEEQTRTYAALAAAFAPDPVIVRTLDIGGDKPVVGIDFPVEDNPFLGWRGIRMCLDRPAVFKPQLRALLRANAGGNLKVMLPMVATLDELRRTRALVAECARELEAEGHAFAPFELGVMIETPAAVLIAPDLAREAAFFSIGTNDLTQYVMAADRLNPALAALNDVRDPAVMRAIEMTARAGAEAGIMVGMCGEAAADPALIPRFLEMGITEFSMSPAAILKAKQVVSRLAGTQAP